MKVAVVFLASLSLVFSAGLVRRNTNDVAEARDKFVSLFQWGKMGNVLTEYLYRDPEVHALVAYLGSEEFKNIFRELDGDSHYHDLLDFLESAGINAIKVHNVVHALLGLPTMPVDKEHEGLPITGGLKGLLKDAAEAVDTDELKRWIMQLAATNLFKTLSDLPEQPFSQELANLPQVKKMMTKLESFGVHIPNTAAAKLPKQQ